MIRAALSPCPNDTYLICAWASNWLPAATPKLSLDFAPIHQLNVWASEQTHALCKISLFHYPAIAKNYWLAPVGVAFGNGRGPQLVARTPRQVDACRQGLIAVPGRNTIAHFLCHQLLAPSLQLLFCPFDQVIPALVSGAVELGIVIHEARFELERYGLHCIANLGQLWQTRFKREIPLGGIAIHRDLSAHEQKEVLTALRASLKYADTAPQQCMNYILKRAQTKEWGKLLQHIELHVCNQTRNLDAIGTEMLAHFFSLQNYCVPPQQWLLT